MTTNGGHVLMFTRPLQNLNFILLEPFVGGLSCSGSMSFCLTCPWISNSQTDELEILLQNFLAESIMEVFLICGLHNITPPPPCPTGSTVVFYSGRNGTPSGSAPRLINPSNALPKVIRAITVCCCDSIQTSLNVLGSRLSSPRHSHTVAISAQCLLTSRAMNTDLYRCEKGLQLPGYFYRSFVTSSVGLRCSLGDILDVCHFGRVAVFLNHGGGDSAALE